MNASLIWITATRQGLARFNRIWTVYATQLVLQNMQMHLQNYPMSLGSAALLAVIPLCRTKQIPANMQYT